MSIEAFAHRWAQTPVLAGQPPEVLAAAHADRLRNRPAGLAAALRGLGTGALPPLWERLGEIRIPVALVVGERDEKFKAIADQMAARLPDGRSHCRARRRPRRAPRGAGARGVSDRDHARAP